MIGVLAFVGMIFLLWWTSKILKRTGSVLTGWSNDLASIAYQHKMVRNEALRQQNKKLAECLQNIKGEQPHVVYTEQAKREIDDLCREIESQD